MQDTDLKKPKDIDLEKVLKKSITQIKKLPGIDSSESVYMDFHHTLNAPLDADDIFKTYSSRFTGTRCSTIMDTTTHVSIRNKGSYSRSLFGCYMTEYPSCCGTVICSSFSIGFYNKNEIESFLENFEHILDLLSVLAQIRGYSTLSFVLTNNGMYKSMMNSITNKEYRIISEFKNRRSNNMCYLYEKSLLKPLLK